MNFLVKGLAYLKDMKFINMVDIVIIIVCEGHLFWSIQNLIPTTESSMCSSYNISNFGGGGFPFLPHSEFVSYWDDSTLTNSNDNNNKLLWRPSQGAKHCSKHFLWIVSLTLHHHPMKERTGEDKRRCYYIGPQNNVTQKTEAHFSLL